jgi:hypothetical protein
VRVLVRDFTVGRCRPSVTSNVLLPALLPTPPALSLSLSYFLNPESKFKSVCQFFTLIKKDLQLDFNAFAFDFLWIVAIVVVSLPWRRSCWRVGHDDLKLQSKLIIN